MKKYSAGYDGTVTTGVERGRRRNAYPEFLCPRIALLQRVFANAISSSDWENMNRPMNVPYDESEEKQRRREYSEMLKRLPYSDLSVDCDPEKDSAYPALILHWQYERSLLMVGMNSAGGKREPIFFKVPKNVVEWRSEYARNLAVYLVARQAKKSEQYLVKLCRKFAHFPGE